MDAVGRARGPLCVAHRGGGGIAPENTLAACRAALRLGVDAVEIDVRLTRDGVPVALHDATLDRTSNGRGALAEHTLAALSTVDATARFAARRFPPEPPPTLASVLACVGDGAAVHVELKGDPEVPPTLVAAVADVLGQTRPAPNVLLISFDWEALRGARRLAPGVPVGALAAAWPAAAAAALARLAAEGVSWLGVRYGVVTPARIRAARAAGLRLGVWTVNQPASLHRALALGVDAITTDRPDRLIPLLASARPRLVE